jgi:hypothetical protein
MSAASDVDENVTEATNAKKASSSAVMTTSCVKIATIRYRVD